MKIDHESKVECIFGKHIWENEIYTFLKEMRLESANIKKNCEFKVKFEESDKIEGCILNWIDQIITCSGGENYSRNKKEISQNAGYENGNYQMDIKLSTAISAEDIVNMEIGIGQPILIESGEAYERRFGVRGNTIIPKTGGRLSIECPPVKVKVHIKKRGNRKISCNALRYAPMLVRRDSRDYAERISFPGMDIIARKDGNTQFRPNIEGTHSVSEWMFFFNFMNASCHKGTSFEVRQAGKKFLYGAVTTLNEGGGDYRIWHSASAFLLKCLQFEGLENMKLSFDEISYSIKNSDHTLVVLGSGSFSFSNQIEGIPESLREKPLCGYASFPLKGRTFGLSFKCQVNKRKCDRHTVAFEKVRILSTYFFDNPDVLSMEHAKEYLELDELDCEQNTILDSLNDLCIELIENRNQSNPSHAQSRSAS